MIKALIIGANGQLCSDLLKECEHQGYEIISANHSDIMVEDIDSVLYDVLGCINAGVDEHVSELFSPIDLKTLYKQ